MRVAETVVYCHACDCGSASRPVVEGEEPEHRFDVDGEPFPYMISPEGPTFTRLSEDWYRVDLTIYPSVVDGDGEAVRIDKAGMGHQLFIGGVEFPWAIHEDGVVVRVPRKSWATIELGFLARSVDTDGPVFDGQTQAEA